MSSILDTLNKEQTEAVKQINGPVMVFAGAGTGKTKTLTARVAYMVQECGIHPYNILAITFTKKATNEMRERLENILDDDAKFLNISTIHSLCVKILRRYIDLIGYERNFEIVDDEDQIKIIQDIYKKLDIDKRTLTPKVAAKLIGDYKNGLVPLAKIIADLYQEYEATLQFNNQLDFDDLLIKVEKLFTEHPECLSYYQNLFKYILVDEFQDTNKIQYHIIKLLAENHHNLFVVGDDDQSIYSFRGATIENMLGFTNDYPDAHVVKLLQNYRSHQSILKGANAVIANNQNREPKKLYSEINGTMDDVIIQEASDYEVEARFIANEITHLVDSGSYNYADIAVLFRNSALSLNIEKALIERKIPYNVYGGFSYLKRKEVKDIISYFRFIVDPDRVAHFKRIINLQPRGVGEKTLDYVVKVMNDNGCSLFAAIKAVNESNPSTKNAALLDFVNQITDFREKIETMSLVEFFDYMMKETGYLEKLKEDDMDEKTNRVDNVNEFKSILYNIDLNINDEEMSQKDKLRYGLDDIILDQSFENERADAVTLSTIHSIKGLEYEVVFVAALEEGIFPSYRDDIEIEEERRVAYVAFTRAKSKIYLSCAKKRLIYGRFTQNKISRFLVEYLTADEVKESVERKKEIDEIENANEIHLGSKIYHKYFGYGQIVAMDDTFMQIIFENKEIKKIKKGYPLKVLD